MADWGLYGAMRGTDNWAQRRADKAMELSIIEKQNQVEEVKTQRALAAEEGINKYFDELRNMDVLPEDQERIQNIERNARANVINGIKNYNGDLTRYMSSGGVSDLHEYRNSVLESQEVKQAMTNKANLKSYLEDASKGDMFFHKVGVQIPKLDSEGNPMLDKTGRPIQETRQMDFDQQMALFREGKINAINYNGAEKKVKLNPFMFLKTPKNPRDPYSADNLVTASNVKFQAMEMGASEAYADHLAKEYVNMTKMGGDAWRWGNKDPRELEVMQAKIDKLRGSGAGSGSSGGQRILNTVAPALQRMGQGGEPNQMVMSPVENDFWSKSFGLNYDKESNSFKPGKALAGVDLQNPDFNYDLSNAVSVNLNDRYVARKDKNGNLKRYVEATVFYDADRPGKNNPHYEQMGFNNALVDTSIRNNWVETTEDESGVYGTEDGNLWRGTVLIPIEEQINTPTFRTSMNKFIGHRSNQDAAAASATNEDYQMYLFNQAQNIAQSTDLTMAEAMMYVEQLQRESQQ